MYEEDAMNLKPPDPRCARCGALLPAADSGSMVMGLPGVGTFHDGCEPTWRQRLLHRIHRLLAPKPVELPAGRARLG
jgi:hypothetical protein